MKSVVLLFEGKRRNLNKIYFLFFFSSWRFIDSKHSKRNVISLPPEEYDQFFNLRTASEILIEFEKKKKIKKFHLLSLAR